ncbi:MAG: fasciclin domain-containing protein [Pseudomonadota bacterium]
MTGYRTLFAAAVLGSGLISQQAVSAPSAQSTVCKCHHEAASLTDYGVFVSMMKSAEADGTFSRPSRSTVFAPSDHAMSSFIGSLERLDADARANAIAGFLRKHVIPGAVSTDIPPRGLSRTATLSDGATIDLKRGRATLRVDDARIVKANIETPSGYLHVIDRALTVSVVVAA